MFVREAEIKARVGATGDPPLSAGLYITVYKNERTFYRQFGWTAEVEAFVPMYGIKAFYFEKRRGSDCLREDLASMEGNMFPKY